MPKRAKPSTPSSGPSKTKAYKKRAPVKPPENTNEAQPEPVETTTTEIVLKRLEVAVGILDAQLGSIVGAYNSQMGGIHKRLGLLEKGSSMGGLAGPSQLDADRLKAIEESIKDFDRMLAPYAIDRVRMHQRLKALENNSCVAGPPDDAPMKAESPSVSGPEVFSKEYQEASKKVNDVTRELCEAIPDLMGGMGEKLAHISAQLDHVLSTVPEKKKETYKDKPVSEFKSTTKRKWDSLAPGIYRAEGALGSEYVVIKAELGHSSSGKGDRAYNRLGVLVSMGEGIIYNINNDLLRIIGPVFPGA